MGSAAAAGVGAAGAAGAGTGGFGGCTAVATGGRGGCTDEDDAAVDIGRAGTTGGSGAATVVAEVVELLGDGFVLDALLLDRSELKSTQINNTKHVNYSFKNTHSNRKSYHRVAPPT